MNSNKVIATLQREKMDILSSRVLVEEKTVWFNLQDPRVVPGKNKVFAPIMLLPKDLVERNLFFAHRCLTASKPFGGIGVINTQEWLDTCITLKSAFHYMHDNMSASLLEFDEELGGYLRRNIIKYYDLEGLSKEDKDELKPNDHMLDSRFITRLLAAIEEIQEYFHNKNYPISNSDMDDLVKRMASFEKQIADCGISIEIISECREVLLKLQKWQELNQSH